MKDTFEITLRYYPSDDYNEAVSIRRVVSRKEVALSTFYDKKKIEFVDMIRQIEAAIKPEEPKKKGDKFCPCGNDPVDCWYCEDAEYKATHGGKSQWK